MSDTFCILPWMHLATSASGTLRVCCNSTPGDNIIKRKNGHPYRIGDTDLTDAWNSSMMQGIRHDLLHNKRPTICSRCFKEEDAGIKSARESWNQAWMFEYEHSTTPPMQIKYIDLRLGNLCNLKCRMCNPYASSQWVNEWNTVGGSLTPSEIDNLKKMDWFDNTQVWDNIAGFADSIEEIYLTGGEPTLAISQYILFDKLIQLGVANKIRLKYNTNLTNIPEKMLEYWSHFKQIKINASIDAVGDLNRYIRYPTAWSSVEKNLRIFRDMELDGKCKLQIHITVQAYNILDLDRLMAYLSNGNYNDIHLNVLNHPKHLNIKVLPEKLKDIAATKLSKWAHIDRIRGIIQYMNCENWHDQEWQRFMEYTATLDATRGQDICSIVPLFSEFKHAQ